MQQVHRAVSHKAVQVVSPVTTSAAAFLRLTGTHALAACSAAARTASAMAHVMPYDDMPKLLPLELCLPSGDRAVLLACSAQVLSASACCHHRGFTSIVHGECPGQCWWPCYCYIALDSMRNR